MRIGRFAFGECSSLTLPPEGDDAISPLSPLRPPRKSFAFALRTAAVPPGRHIGTRECCNVKPLRLRDTALAALDGVCSNYAAAHRYRFATHSFNGWRCCPIPPLYKGLLGRAFSLRSPLRAGALLSSPSFPHQGALALFAWRQSGFIANGTRRLTFFATPSTADNGTAVRAVIGRVRNRRLCQLPDLYAYATPHSLRSYGVCSVARSLSRYSFGANSFRQAAPKPTYAPTALCCRPLVPFSARA